MRVAIRRIGNSQGIVIPKPMLLQAGLEDEVELTEEDGALVLRRPSRPPREGWDESARRVADAEDDVLVMGDLANEGDEDLTW